MKQESKALVTGAAGKLAAFVSACERELTAEVVNGYLCDGFAELCRVLNGLRMENSDLETLAAGAAMSYLAKGEAVDVGALRETLRANGCLVDADALPPIEPRCDP